MTLQGISIVASALAIMSTAAFGGEIPTYDRLMSDAAAAFEREDWQALAGALDRAQTLRPYSLYLTKNRILAYALKGDKEAAADIAGKVADRGLSISFTGHPGLVALAEDERFKPIIGRMSENLSPKGEEMIAFEITERDLLPESVVVTGKGHALIGSVRTGRVVTESGVDFANAPGGVYGLVAKGDAFWAVANAQPPYAGPAAIPASGFFAFDAMSGQRLCEILFSEPNAILGAIERTPAGLVASDSLTPRLLRLGGCEDAPVVFSEDSRFVNLQGVAYDRKRKRLYVADYLAGIFAVDSRTGEATPLENVADAHLGGIDGLYVYKGDLIGVQNGATPQRIVRLNLDRSGLRVTRLEVIQQALKGWREPTNGQIVGNALYYVATSNWPVYGDDGAPKQGVERAPARVMIAPLQ